MQPNLQRGVPIFGKAKKSKCPGGTRRMVKTTPKANHKAPTHFQAAYAPSIGSLKPLQNLNGSLKSKMERQRLVAKRLIQHGFVD